MSLWTDEENAAIDDEMNRLNQDIKDSEPGQEKREARDEKFAYVNQIREESRKRIAALSPHQRKQFIEWRDLKKRGVKLPGPYPWPQGQVRRSAGPYHLIVDPSRLTEEERSSFGCQTFRISSECDCGGRKGHVPGGFHCRKDM